MFLKISRVYCLSERFRDNFNDRLNLLVLGRFFSPAFSISSLHFSVFLLCVIYWICGENETTILNKILIWLESVNAFRISTNLKNNISIFGSKCYSLKTKTEENSPWPDFFREEKIWKEAGIISSYGQIHTLYFHLEECVCKTENVIKLHRFVLTDWLVVYLWCIFCKEKPYAKQ